MPSAEADLRRWVIKEDMGKTCTKERLYSDKWRRIGESLPIYILEKATFALERAAMGGGRVPLSTGREVGIGLSGFLA